MSRARRCATSRLGALLCIVAAGAVAATGSINSACAQTRTETKVLLYSTINEWWLQDTIQKWAQSGFAGFIVTSYVQWFTTSAELEQHRPHFANLTQRGARHGITDNFINIQLAATTYDTGATLPAWQDEAAWSALLSGNLKAIATFARTTGMKGITLDTEPYEANLWTVNHPRHKGLSKRTLETLAYDKGSRLMAALRDAYPGIQVILLQEGSFWWIAQSDRHYELWPAFYNGMASSQPTPGLIVGVESTYPEDELLDALKRKPGAFILDRAAEIQQSMATIAKLPAYWKKEGSLAIGMRPLGVSYSDKRARYPAAVFQAQMDAARTASGKYVWVYGHGNAWWQMTPQEVNTYSAEPWHYTFDKASQVLPVDPDAAAYFAVVRSASSAPASPQPKPGAK